MALVAYDNSDSSEFEDDADENINSRFNGSDDIASASVIPNDLSESESVPNLFNHLPQPSKGKKTIIEEDDEFLHIKDPKPDIVKPKSRITIPSLSDFKDVEQTIPNNKMNKPANGKKSGLLSILPQPRNKIMSTTKSLIPNILTQKPQSSTVKKKQPLPSPAKIKKTTTKSTLVTEYSDESDNDEELQNDFFSIHKTIELPPDSHLDIDLEPAPKQISKEPRSLESYFKKEPQHVELQPDLELNEPAEYLGETNTSEPTQSIAEISSNNMVLDEEAILKLSGARGKRKREEIQIVDVNQQEILDEARALLLEGLMKDSSKIQPVSKKRGNEPTSQQKRKHQITYLAHQAKANETELQNQWANNRMSRKQTQSKYGF